MRPLTTDVRAENDRPYFLWDEDTTIAEIRDLVDLYCLERAGFPVERFLADAQQKDAGVTPATLAWVLSEAVVPDALPGDVDAVALRAFAADLEMRLRRMALPSGS